MVGPRHLIDTVVEELKAIFASQMLVTKSKRLKDSMICTDVLPQLPTQNYHVCEVLWGLHMDQTSHHSSL